MAALNRVFGSTLWTLDLCRAWNWGTLTAHVKHNAAAAHRTAHARWISMGQRVIGHIPGYHGTSAYHAESAEGHSAHNRGVGPDSCAFADQSPPELCFSLDECARIDHVREDHRRAAEHPLLKLDPLVDRHVILHLTAVTYGDVRSNDDVLADSATAADSSVLRARG